MIFILQTLISAAIEAATNPRVALAMFFGGIAAANAAEASR